MSTDKELAYRYDLFIASDWRERFDTLLDEKIEFPAEGRILEVNSGTGGHAIELAERMKEKGNVIGTDAFPERLEIARAKAQVKKVSDVEFKEADATSLPFSDDEFDIVIGDSSMMSAREMEKALEEMLRVARPGARVVLMASTNGSFDEFFSIYWEVLQKAGLVEEVWAKLENLIKERGTVSEVESMAGRLGLRDIESFTSKEEFLYETGESFITDPMIEDAFLEKWLSIVPAERHQEVRDSIASLIDAERHNAPFYISIKAALITGVK